jgi:hypothetical protein
MTTERDRLKKLEAAKKTARKAANQVKLSMPIAESRADWQNRWAQLQAYAGMTALTYCSRRLKQYSLDQIEEVRDEALSEAWRYVCNGESAELAIVKAVDSITKTHQAHWAQARPLPELEDNSPEYREGKEHVRELVWNLPERLRPLAICLSAGMDSTTELAEMLQCTERTIQLQKNELAKRLGSRFGWELLAQWEVPIPERLAS